MIKPLLLILFVLSTLFLISGCEKDESAADRRVSQNIQSSREVLNKKDGDAAKAHKFLETAARETAASSASKATAKALLAQSNFDAAVKALPQLNSTEAETQKYIRELTRLGGEVADEVTLIESLKGQNPSASAADPLKGLSATKATFTAQVAELDKTLKQLEAQKQTLTSKISSLDTEHKSKLELAAGLMQKSEAAQGQESVDFFKQSTAVRQSATILARDLQFARADLARAQVLIADTQKARTVADAAVNMAQKQIEQLNQGWATVEESMKKRQAALAREITSETHLAGAAKNFAAAKDKTAAARNEIDERHLEPAIAAYEDADKEAKKLMSEISAQLRDPKNTETPARVAWQRIERLYDPITYRLGKARALELRGQLFARERNILLIQQNLAASLQPHFQRGGLTMPPELAPTDLAQQLDTATKNALRDFTDSLALLKDILETDKVQRNLWPQSNEARQLHVTVEYALHHLEPDKGHLDSAKSSLKMISDTGQSLPSLPTDLEMRNITAIPVVSAAERPPTNPTAATTNDSSRPPAPAGSGSAGGSAWKKLLNKATGAFGQGQPGQPPPVPPPDQQQQQ